MIEDGFGHRRAADIAQTDKQNADFFLSTHVLPA
jgi:hypothetical protein